MFTKNQVFRVRIKHLRNGRVSTLSNVSKFPYIFLSILNSGINSSNRPICLVSPSPQTVHTVPTRMSSDSLILCRMTVFTVDRTFKMDWRNSSYFVIKETRNQVYQCFQRVEESSYILYKEREDLILRPFVSQI